jgi:hypothetical protein
MVKAARGIKVAVVITDPESEEVRIFANCCDGCVCRLLEAGIEIVEDDQCATVP